MFYDDRFGHIICLHKDFVAFTLSLAPEVESSGFKNALCSNKWIMVMNEEISTLQLNYTWDLVPRKPNMNVIRSKWVYKLKRNAK